MAGQRELILGMLAVPITGVLAARLPHVLFGLPGWRWLLAASSVLRPRLRR